MQRSHVKYKRSGDSVGVYAYDKKHKVEYQAIGEDAKIPTIRVENYYERDYTLILEFKHFHALMAFFAKCPDEYKKVHDESSEKDESLKKDSAWKKITPGTDLSTLKSCDCKVNIERHFLRDFSFSHFVREKGESSSSYILEFECNIEKYDVKVLKPILFLLYQIGDVDPDVIRQLITDLNHIVYSIELDDALNFAKKGYFDMSITLLSSIGDFCKPSIEMVFEKCGFDFAFRFASIDYPGKKRRFCELGRLALTHASIDPALRVTKAIQCYSSIDKDFNICFGEPEEHEARFMHIFLLRAEGKIEKLSQLSLSDLEKLFIHAVKSSDFNPELIELLFQHLCGNPSLCFFGDKIPGKDSSPYPFIEIAKQIRILANTNKELEKMSKELGEENKRLKSSGSESSLTTKSHAASFFTRQ